MESRADDATVRSVRRALAILRAFGPLDRSLPLGEIARRAGLDKATARRLLRTLIDERVIEQPRASKDYVLGFGALTLVAGPTQADPLRRSALPLLAGIAEATGATAFLAIVHDGAALCIEAAAGGHSAAVPDRVGVRTPLHAGAVPRVLMAFLPLETRMTLLAGPLPPVSEATPTDPFQLSARLDAIRQRDWDASANEVTDGVASVGVPVRDASGDVVAALGITGPVAELLEGGQPRQLELLRGRALDLERRIAGLRDKTTPQAARMPSVPP
jgi:DNA-binding IclR family transcriptional regulator